jgi:uroporphyrinogen-III synthase
LKKLSSGTAEAPGILREIGGESFERAAQLAEALLKITRASVLYIGGSGNDEILDEANASREAFSEVFRDLLPSIVG